MAKAQIKLNCTVCAKEFSTLRDNWLRRGTRFCSPRCVVVKRKQLTTEERFWSAVEKRGPTECWEWKRSRSYGYGQFKFEGGGVRAHRYSWQLHNGKKIPNDLHVLHRCDNPPCVNPNHLFVGTPLDNTMDSVRKGRHKGFGYKDVNIRFNPA